MTKIVSFNLKRIFNLCDEVKDKRFVHILFKSEADIICLQETNIKLTKYLTDELTKKTGILHNFEYKENNAIITYYHIMSIESKLIKIKGIYIDRSYITMKLDDPKLRTQYKITVFHLDHLLEDTRILQLNEVNEMLKTTDILVGDFNSIKKQDYSDTLIETIDQMRKTNNKEKVDFRVIEFIENYGFKTNKFIMETCPYDTRVDYVFMKPTITNNYESTDGVINYIKEDVTDHNMIWTIIYPKKSITVK
jgi:endonuclease/exonuclease/phosphatase family metal-dependent hydrolase